MTEPRRQSEPPPPPPPGATFPEQNADGVDLTLIRENLKLTPLERVRKAERLRQQILASGSNSPDGGPSRSDPKPAATAGTLRPFPEQDARGVDLSLIRENLKLTPVERIRRGERGRQQALRLLEIGRQHRERRKHPA